MVDFNEMSKKRVVYEIPGMEKARVVKSQVYKTVDGMDLLFDVYYPADLQEGEHHPAVLFVHGLGAAEFTKNLKESGQYISWGQLAAASGLIAVTFNHRSPDEHISLRDVAGEVDSLVSYVREHAHELSIDKERLAIWAGSAGVPLGVRAALFGTPAFIKCLVAYYGPLDLRELQKVWKLSDDEVRDLSAITYLEEHPEKLAPLFIAKAGLDYPELNASIDNFLTRASTKNVELDFLIHPNGKHAFDILDDVPRSHDIIKRTLEFIKTSVMDAPNRSA